MLRCAAAFAGCYKGNVKWYALVVFAICWIATALSFYALPQVRIAPQNICMLASALQNLGVP